MKTFFIFQGMEPVSVLILYFIDLMDGYETLEKRATFGVSSKTLEKRTTFPSVATVVLPSAQRSHANLIPCWLPLLVESKHSQLFGLFCFGKFPCFFLAAHLKRLNLQFLMILLPVIMKTNYLRKICCFPCTRISQHCLHWLFFIRVMAITKRTRKRAKKRLETRRTAATREKAVALQFTFPLSPVLLIFLWEQQSKNGNFWNFISCTLFLDHTNPLEILVQTLHKGSKNFCMLFVQKNCAFLNALLPCKKILLFSCSTRTFWTQRVDKYVWVMNSSLWCSRSHNALFLVVFYRAK